MKTAIYIEDGTMQLVITPESEFEKNALDNLQDFPLEAKIFSGTFYDCRGGWVRQKPYYHGGMSSFGSSEEDKSLILRVSQGEAATSP